MTAQVSDIFLFKGDAYDLIGMDGSGLASPEQFGIEAEMMHTGCYRGFYAIYEFMEEVLYLRELTLREKEGNYLTIEGVEPEKEEHQATYHGLNIVISFTGKIRIAKEFIKKFYTHMGYQKSTAFKTVLDITLKDGRIVEIKDRSAEMEKKRSSFKKHYKSVNFLPRSKKKAFINKAFSLDMDSE